MDSLKEDEMDPKMPAKKKAETDLETSKENKKAKTDVEISKEKKKKAVLIGLKDRRKNKNAIDTIEIDINKQIKRMKDLLSTQRGFSDKNITLMIEEDKETTKYTKPTSLRIRRTIYELIESAEPGDILFVHLIASGCQEGLILDANNEHITESFFRGAISSALQKGCNLTFLSDCLIESADKCACPKRPRPAAKTQEQVGRIVPLYWLFEPYKLWTQTGLSFVDIHNPKEKTTESSISNPLPSPVILFKSFRHEPIPPSVCLMEDQIFFGDEPLPPSVPFIMEDEIFFPLPMGTTNPFLTSYGGFSRLILDVCDEIIQTGGELTNLKLAEMVNGKLQLERMPGLSCSHHNHAYASFVC